MWKINISQKGQLFTVWELKREDGIALFNLRNVRDNQLKIFATLCMAANDCLGTTSIDLEVTNRF